MSRKYTNEFKESIIKYIEWFNHERISYREISQMKFS